MFDIGIWYTVWGINSCAIGADGTLQALLVDNRGRIKLVLAFFSYFFLNHEQFLWSPLMLGHGCCLLCWQCCHLQRWHTCLHQQEGCLQMLLLCREGWLGKEKVNQQTWQQLYLLTFIMNITGRRTHGLWWWPPSFRHWNDHQGDWEGRLQAWPLRKSSQRIGSRIVTFVILWIQFQTAFRKFGPLPNGILRRAGCGTMPRTVRSLEAWPSTQTPGRSPRNPSGIALGWGDLRVTQRNSSERKLAFDVMSEKYSLNVYCIFST